MNKAFNLLFWGFIFVFLDLRVGINLLPDFIGFILIVNGLTTLENYSKQFKVAKPFAFLSIFYSLVQLFQSPEPAGVVTASEPFHLGWLLYDQIASIFLLVIVYGICAGIIELAEQAMLDKLKIQGEQCWKAFLITNGLYLILVPFSLNVPYLDSLLVILVIVIVIIYIIFLVLLRRVYRWMPIGL